jgi:hypothetical protein
VYLPHQKKSPCYGLALGVIHLKSHAINCNKVAERSIKALITTEFIFPGIGAVLAEAS